MNRIRRSIAALSLGVLALSGISCSGDGQTRLQGDGASFPAPLYTKWFQEYCQAHPEVEVDYQSVGSGQGVTSVINKTVDFGASDAAMSPDEMKKVDVGVQLIPMTAGSIVLAYNLEGVDNLKLSREAYVNIFLGKVTKWNDPAIAKTNEGVQLPDSKINVIVRSDGSGTTFVFSKHLRRDEPRVREKPRHQQAAQLAGGNEIEGERRRGQQYRHDARRDRLYRVRLRQERQGPEDGEVAEQGGKVRGTHDQERAGGPGFGRAAGGSYRLGVRSGR